MLVTALRKALAVAVAASIVLVLVATVGSHADAQTRWVNCGSLTLYTYASQRVTVSGIRALGTSCRSAKAVVHGFYAQEIGSSGAGYAAGFGCVYVGGTRVTCGSGPTGRGARKVVWTQRQ